MGRIVSLLLALVGIFACISCSMIALFLQTLNVLDGRVTAAQVIMYPIQSDNNGEFIDIDFQPYQLQSALLGTVNREPGEPTLGEPQRFRLYGDTIAIRGPLIKLHSALQILGYQNVYKLAVIEGQYRNTNSINQLSGSKAVINGGFESYWWDLNNQEGQYPYNIAIERVTISGDEEFGFRGSGAKVYNLVVTNQGITWDFVEQR